MKNIYYLFALLFATTTSFAQDETLECGTEYLLKQYFEDNPEAKNTYDNFNLELSKFSKNDELSRKISSKIQQGQVYEIPIVVHVLSKGDAIGTDNNPDDQQIIDWINYTNKIFDGTGDRILNDTNGGTVIPVKLVLAKIDPKGKVINGINRIDLSNNEQFVKYGLNALSGFNGLHDAEVIKQYGWESTKYYNIYVAHRVMIRMNIVNAYAALPSEDLSNDKTVINTSLTKVGIQTLAHEIGHALGLRHTHEGYSAGEATLLRDENRRYVRDNNGDYVINVTKPAICPLNDNCALQGDFVCDTEPILSLYDPTANLYRCLTGVINQCTGSPYAGGEQNIMSYTSCTRNRFTPGQMERVMAYLLRYRENLFTSSVLDNQAKNNRMPIIPARCSPRNNPTKDNFRIGTVNVNFNEINNWTTPYNRLENNFYRDYTRNYSLAKTTTTIPYNSSTRLRIRNSDINYQHAIKVYIDYNNDGIFSETDELVLSRKNILQNRVTSVNVRPPRHAVLNRALRMRVISDYTTSNIWPCVNPTYGDVEDYAVTIVNNTFSRSNIDFNKIIIGSSGSSILVNANDIIANVMITDITGKLIYKEDNIKNNNFSKVMNTKNQVYVVVVSLENGTKHSQKVML